ncbi:MAG TPA: hybrid sensor histidine kinase/response regulator [Myxococcales bacterium]|nr:hybrid sensor histidine kinase/response regulator [Myxococcales bacterium]
MDDPRPAVLVVDDEPLNRSLIRATLGASYDVVEAGSGPEALSLLAQRRFDLVLLDVMMPRMSGYDVCRRIKEEQREYLPVLLVTALGEQEERNRGLEAGADDFLSKPVDRRELMLRVRTFLRLKEQDRMIRSQLDQVRRLQAAKDDLVALLVHDLRSPLAGIVAHLQLLQMDLHGEQANDVKYALSAADTALARLEQTLQVRLLEEGRLSVKRRPMSLSRAVDATLEGLHAVASRKGVELRRDIEAELQLPLDEELVRRALENLVSNAVKYTAAGGDVVVGVHPGPGGVAVEVADRGPGIPAELKPQMFEKFGSLEAARGHIRKGIGLGLYLVKLVAEGHGGAVSVEDRPGGGSIFRLTLGAA